MPRGRGHETATTRPDASGTLSPSGYVPDRQQHALAEAGGLGAFLTSCWGEASVRLEHDTMPARLHCA